MPVPFLSGIDLNNTELINAVLHAVRLREGASHNPQPGEIFRLADGTPYFINSAGIPMPVHENSLTEISGMAPLSFTTNGRAVQAQVADASAATSGVLSAEHYSLLAGATVQNEDGTLVRRGFDGSPTYLASLVTGRVQTSYVEGLLPNPSTDDSATSKIYVDSLVQDSTRNLRAGLDSKDSVRIALNTNLPLTSGPGTYDGVAIAAGESILLVGQTNPTENGCYDVAAGGLVRRADSNTPANLNAGALYQVESGTFQQHFFTLINSPAAIGTDPLTFLDISGVNVLRAGDSIQIANQTISALGTVGRIVAGANGLDIAPEFDADINRRIATAISDTKYYETIGNGTDLSYVVTHNLGTVDPDVRIREATIPGDYVYPDVRVESANAVRISFGTPPAVAAYRVKVSL
jgi:hypothetical protein